MAPFLIMSPLTLFVPFLSTTTTTTIGRWGGNHYRRDYNRLASSTSTNNAADILPTIRQGIEDQLGEERLDQWNDSVAVLTDQIATTMKNMKDSARTTVKEEAELLLADAGGWKGWAMAGERARKYMNPQVLTAKQLEHIWDWLTNPKTGPLGLDHDTCLEYIRNHPKIYLSSELESNYQAALAAAPFPPSDAATILKDMILEDPSILQYTYNCGVEDDGCASECGNCWVTYSKRKR